MNELEFIKKTIKRISKGKPFFAESLCDKFLSKNVYQVLSQLVKTCEILRIARDMYVRPKRCSYLKGEFLTPCSDVIIKAISKKTGEVISMHGADAINRIGLSTQVPVRAIYYTTGRSRQIKINEKFGIRLVHINPKKLVMPGTVTCIVITALWYLRSDGANLVTPLAIKKIFITELGLSILLKCLSILKRCLSGWKKYL